MIVVIIAGGSGTRLWPLSTSNFPKHLLNLVGDDSMLQQAYQRAKRAGDEVYVVTEASHADQVVKQLPDLPGDHILIEPGRRGTANCILMALDAIARTHKTSEPIAFIHSDHVIHDVDGFARSLQTAAKISSENNAITLTGIVPTYPATGFGYIEKGAKQDEAFVVKSFKEKPEAKVAEEYFQNGKYLWNAGYFVGSVETFLHEIARSSQAMQQGWEQLSRVKNIFSEAYNKTYLALPNEVIDVALMEPAKELLVVPAQFDWADVGNFKDLHDILEKGEADNYLAGDNIFAVQCGNSYIRNEEDKPVALIGLDNVVVVNTKGGVLIADREVAHRTGEIAKELNQRKETK